MTLPDPSDVVKRPSLASAVIPKTPRGLAWLHTALLGVATGVLSYAAGAVAAAGNTPHFWHSFLIGCATAGASRLLGALVNLLATETQ